MAEHYDVIIIGTGAGGGTLAHTLAAVGQADPAARAGRLPAPRDGQLGSRRRCSSTAATSRTDTWYDADGTAVPAPGPLLRRRRHEDVRRRAVPAPARRTSASCKHVDGISPAWPLDLRRLRAVVHEGRVAVPGARQPRRGPDRGPLEQAVPVAGGVARAADPAAVRRPRAGRLPPVPRAVRHPARRGRPRAQHLHPLHLVRRLPVPRARQVRRRDHRGAAGARPAERDAARRTPR